MKKHLKLLGYVLVILIFVACFFTVLDSSKNAGDRAGAGAIMLLLYLWDKFSKMEDQQKKFQELLEKIASEKSN